MLKTHTQAEVDEAVTFATAKATEQAKTEARAEAEQSISAKVEAAVKLERERISGIDAKTLPGHEKLAAECKSDGTTVEAFAVKQIDAEKTTREQRLAAIKKDGKTTEAAAVATETGDKTVVDESALPIEERAKAEFEREPAIRKEFGTLPPYVAYRKAEAAGRVRNIRRAG